MRQDSADPKRQHPPWRMEGPRAADLIESPERVAGHISAREGEWIAASGAGKTVLEIGAFRGRSTIYLARSATKVITCDHFKGQVRLLPAQRKLDMSQVERHWHLNVAAAGVLSKVSLIKEDSLALHNYLAEPGAPRFDFIFVDGGHDSETLTSDVRLADFLHPGGTIAFHDFYSAKFPEVRQVVTEWLSRNSTTFSKGASVGTIQAYRRIAGTRAAQKR